MQYSNPKVNIIIITISTVKTNMNIKVHTCMYTGIYILQLYNYD